MLVPKPNIPMHITACKSNTQGQHYLARKHEKALAPQRTLTCTCRLVLAHTHTHTRQHARTRMQHNTHAHMRAPLMCSHMAWVLHARTHQNRSHPLACWPGPARPPHTWAGPRSLSPSAPPSCPARCRSLMGSCRRRGCPCARAQQQPQAGRPQGHLCPLVYMRPHAHTCALSCTSDPMHTPVPRRPSPASQIHTRVHLCHARLYQARLSYANNMHAPVPRRPAQATQTTHADLPCMHV